MLVEPRVTVPVTTGKLLAAPTTSVAPLETDRLSPTVSWSPATSSVPEVTVRSFRMVMLTEVGETLLVEPRATVRFQKVLTLVSPGPPKLGVVALPSRLAVLDPPL